MDLSLHSFILVIGLLVMAYIAYDGIKKIRAARKERINFQSAKSSAQPQDFFSAELPNGGARIVSKTSLKTPKPLSLDDELLDELPAYPVARDTHDTQDTDETDDFFAQPVDNKPAFINPVIVEKNKITEKPVAQPKAAPVKGPENELLKSVIRQTEALKAAVHKPEIKEPVRTEPVISADPAELEEDTFSALEIDEELLMDDDSLTAVAQVKPAVPPAADIKPASAVLKTPLNKPVAQAKPAIKPLSVDMSEAVPMLMDSVKLGDGIVDQFVPKQQEIDWDAEINEPVSEMLAQDTPEPEEVTEPAMEIDPAFAVSPEGELLSQRAPAEEVIVIHVLANAGEVFDGAKLKHIFKACDLRFGEMDIFHRFEQANASGKIQFSIANAVKPGTFDLANMQDMQTPGLSFFMSLPGPEKALEAFDTLYQVAQVVAKNLGGELHDETHSDLTPQTLEHYRQRIADFTRKRRLNKPLK